jgi:hypothetical protein
MLCPIVALFQYLLKLLSPTFSPNPPDPPPFSVNSPNPLQIVLVRNQIYDAIFEAAFIRIKWMDGGVPT